MLNLKFCRSIAQSPDIVPTYLLFKHRYYWCLFEHSRSSMYNLKRTNFTILLPDGPQIMWVLGSPGEERNRISNYVLQRLSIIAVICLLSCICMNLTCLISINLDSRPSLHLSISGTFWAGNFSLILQELQLSGWSSPVLSLRYLKEQ